MCVLFFMGKGGGGGEGGKTREVKATAIFSPLSLKKGRLIAGLILTCYQFYSVFLPCYFFCLYLYSFWKRIRFFTFTKTLGYGVSLRHSRISA